MRFRFLLSVVAILVVGIAGSALAAKAIKVGGSVEYALAPPAGNEREGALSGDLDTRKVCRKKRTVTLLPASDNFPNTTGYVIQLTTTKSGRFAGVYRVPGKPGAYGFTLTVEKVKRKVKGKTYLCKARHAAAATVTTS